MYYVYLLWSSKAQKFYIGSTSDLRQRLISHNTGSNVSTKYGRPWVVQYYEAYPTKADALRREIKLKRHGKGLAELKKRITLKEDEKVRGSD